MRVLQTAEIVIITGILFITIIIGFLNKANGQNAGKAKASLFTLTVSIVVTFSSSIAMMGVPSEVWSYGPRYCLIGICYLPIAYVVSKYFIPRFCGRGYESSFEVLEERFDKTTSKIAISIYLFQCLIYLGVTLYAPALALSTVVNVGTNLILLSMFIVCVITTALGGMKAVLISDAFFGVVMISGQIWILMTGISDVVKNGTSFDFPAYEYDIFQFKKYSIWDSGFGAFFMCLYLYGVNQASIQRYLSASSTADAKKSIFLSMTALLLVLIIGFGFGTLIMIEYPKGNGLPDGADSRDQLMILYVFTKFENHRLFRGLFVGCMLSAALSTASSIIAVISSIIYVDILRRNDGKLFGKYISGRGISILTGVICYFVALLVSHLGSTVIKLAMTNFGVCGGPILSLYCIGFFTDHSIVAAQTGTLVSLFVTGFLGFGSALGLNTGIPFLFLSFLGFFISLSVSYAVDLFKKKSSFVTISLETENLKTVL